jgi:hypothetical protein
MALISCHECGHRVSTEAAACPGCGAPPRAIPQPAAPEPVVTASQSLVVPTPAQTTVVDERRAVPATAADEPSLAWLAWTTGAVLVLLVVLAVVNLDPRDAESAASRYQPSENRRAADSIAVLALAAAATSMPAERLVTLEATLHTNGFAVAHDSAHARYSRIMLDSADALIGKGLTAEARGLLGSIGIPHARLDSVRAARLNTRIVRVEEEQARESARQQRLAQEQALEGRIEQIRGLRQGNCTPPARAVRNRVRKNPEWSDEMIATTACNRVQIGMTREQAIAGWGRPRDINRTSGSFGVHEQWVYGEYGSGYLYFEDGILTTIQN